MDGKDETNRDYRNLLIQFGADSTRSLDKSLLALSGGALALSVAFIHQVAPEPPRFFLLLYISWLLFILCILFTLWSFQHSQKSAEEHLKGVDAAAANSKAYVFTENSSDRNIAKFNKLSIRSFIVGILFLMLFSFLNPPQKEPTMSNSDEVKKFLDKSEVEKLGVRIPPPPPPDKSQATTTSGQTETPTNTEGDQTTTNKK